MSVTVRPYFNIFKKRDIFHIEGILDYLNFAMIDGIPFIYDNLMLTHTDQDID